MLRRLVLSAFFAAAPSLAATMNTAAKAVNSLGLELLARIAAPGQNALLSPYSVQSALAMAYGGADGATRAEMARVLHYPTNELEIHASFAALRQSLEMATHLRFRPPEQTPLISLAVANRLFGQSGFDFLPSYLALTKEMYASPFEEVDFAKDPAGAVRKINSWIEDQTHKRICGLIPEGAFSKRDPTVLVIVNAVYFKAPWQAEFPSDQTMALPFHLAADKSVQVETMSDQRYVGFTKYEGFSVIAIPYLGAGFQFLIVLPDDLEGLPALERKLDPGWLAGWTKLPAREVILYLPRFKLEPPMTELSKVLMSLDMKTAFAMPPGRADFGRISASYLFISDVFHKSFLSLDEKGTEAAAGTAGGMAYGAIEHEKPKPIEVHVDHPFLMAVQHTASGACLFLGRVTDPRPVGEKDSSAKGSQ